MNRSSLAPLVALTALSGGLVGCASTLQAIDTDQVSLGLSTGTVSLTPQSLGSVGVTLTFHCTTFGCGDQSASLQLEAATGSALPAGVTFTFAPGSVLLTEKDAHLLQGNIYFNTAALNVRVGADAVPGTYDLNVKAFEEAPIDTVTGEAIGRPVMVSQPLRLVITAPKVASVALTRVSSPAGTFSDFSAPVTISSPLTVSGTVQAGSTAVSRLEVRVGGADFSQAIYSATLLTPIAPGQAGPVSLNDIDTSAATPGVFPVFIRAYDASGAPVADSAPVTVQVLAQPAVTITTVSSPAGSFDTFTAPVPVSSPLSVSGTVKAGSAPVRRLEVRIGTASASQAVSSVTLATAIAAGQSSPVTLSNIDLSTATPGTYPAFVRAYDTGGVAVADSVPVTVVVGAATGGGSGPTVSEIRQIGSSLVDPGQTPVVLSGSVNVFARLYGGSAGYNGTVYLCLQRGNPATTGSVNVSVGTQPANIQANAVYDFGYTWDTRGAGNTPADAAYDSLFLSGSRTCDDISNPATTSLIRIKVSN